MAPRAASLASLAVALVAVARVPVTVQRAPAPRPHVVRVSIGQGSVVGSASSVAVTFSVAMGPTLVRYTTSLVVGGMTA